MKTQQVKVIPTTSTPLPHWPPRPRTLQAPRPVPLQPGHPASAGSALGSLGPLTCKGTQRKPLSNPPPGPRAPGGSAGNGGPCPKPAGSSEPSLSTALRPTGLHEPPAARQGQPAPPGLKQLSLCPERPPEEHRLLQPTFPEPGPPQLSGPNHLAQPRLWATKGFSSSSGTGMEGHVQSHTETTHLHHSPSISQSSNHLTCRLRSLPLLMPTSSPGRPEAPPSFTGIVSNNTPQLLPTCPATSLHVAHCQQRGPDWSRVSQCKLHC